MRGQIIKNLLITSLEEQLKRKHIDSITVNDIIADVGVSRTTFYRHFEDKFALVNWIYGQYRFMNY
ncbi:MAG: TetR/AcrR family transcriptional regulator [Oscillospiraceae bacterium]|nr:TetR/AcrR family transcriptional regulator [Oscillospiraceae bacterium]